MENDGHSQAQVGDTGFLLVIDECGKIIYVSESVGIHIGFNYLDISGQSWFALLHPDDQVFARAQLKDIISKGCSPGTPLPTKCAADDAGVQFPESLRRVDDTVTTVPTSHLDSPPENPPDPSHTHPVTDRTSSITVRILQGRRRQSRQSLQPQSRSKSPNDIVRRVPGTDNGSPDDTVVTHPHVYQSFHFSGITRSLKSSNGTEARGNVWMAVGNLVAAEDRNSSQQPSHFVLRHDVNGNIISVDERCRETQSRIIGTSLGFMMHLAPERHAEMFLRLHPTSKGRRSTSEPPLKHFTGFPPEKLLNTSLYDYVPVEDLPYLVHQYGKLANMTSESIALIHRFRHFPPVSPPDKKSPVESFTYFNCRAYMALNPVTAQLDEIVTLATTMKEAEGEAEMKNQIARLGPLSSQMQLALVVNGHVVNGKGSSKSPMHSPDSNTNEREHSLAGKLEWEKQNGHEDGTSPLLGLNTDPDGVGINLIDSQCSPSKFPELESGNLLGQAANNMPSPGARTISRNGGTASPGRENVSQERRASLQERPPSSAPVFKSPGVLSPHSADIIFEETRKGVNGHSITSPRSSRRSSSAMEADFQASLSNLNAEMESKENNSMKTLFHEQLREKHRFLERSIANQQLQLQQLQHRLLALVNEGANSVTATPHSALQIQLQRPLHKVLELQARLHSHNEQTKLQRARIEAEQANFRSVNGGLGGRHSSRRSSKQNGLHRPSSTSSLSQLNIFSPEDSRNAQASGSLSPPFIDVTDRGENGQRHPQNQPENLFLEDKKDGSSTGLNVTVTAVQSGPKELHQNGTGDDFNGVKLEDDIFNTDAGEGQRTAQEELDFERRLLDLENLLGFDFDFSLQTDSGVGNLSLPTE